MTFRKGQSGNPKGRPKGARNKATLAVEALLDGEAEELTRKAIEIAKQGDIAALRLCLDRIAPPRKDRPIPFALPQLEKPADAVRAFAAIAEGVATGELTPVEAGELSRVVESYVKAVEVSDIDERLRRLEEGQTP